MFGSRIDYLLLRTLAHDRNRRTEEELNAGGSSSLLGDQEETKLPRILARFDGHFPVSPGLAYLDMGCGSGELTLELAAMGLDRVTGVDVLPRFVDRARQNARRLGLGDRVRFECADLHDWTPPHKFDVAISFDALEHIDDPRGFLTTMKRFLRPGGVAAISFGPLFHSPFGDHMSEFFRVQVPWRGALFAEQAVMRVRREMYRPTDPATRYREVAGGLNLMRYSEFLRYAREAGWTFDFLRTNAFLRHAALRRLSARLCATRVVQDYIVHNVYAIMRPVEAAEPERQTAPEMERLAA
jgi:2-polyprenyl-3-methyl-5-hydroxy-6-metoxy-1,4-benzoquinol methylase